MVANSMNPEDMSDEPVDPGIWGSWREALIVGMFALAIWVIALVIGYLIVTWVF